jgi:hypothetical protein
MVTPDGCTPEGGRYDKIFREKCRHGVWNDHVLRCVQDFRDEGDFTVTLAKKDFEKGEKK